MAGKHSFAELRNRMPPDARVKAEAEAKRLSEEMNLAEESQAPANSPEISQE